MSEKLKRNSASEQINHELIIVGAGAAGLTLLLALDELNYPHSVTVLEQNSGPLNDRIWSFWDNAETDKCMPHYIASIIAHEWTSWSLSTQQHEYTMEKSAFRYCALRSEDLSALAQKKVNRNPKFSIVYNCSVSAIVNNQETCSVYTKNEHLITRKVVDTRPPINKEQAGLLQCFYGQEIVVDADIFEVASAQLMHDIKCSHLGIEFVYILPFSKQHALVEFTCFSPTVVDQDILKMRLKEIIKALVKHHKYSLQRTEKAVLPMYLINHNSRRSLLGFSNEFLNKGSSGHNNIIHAGISGGAMRASTGYSFVNSQRWATQCAKRLTYHNSFASQPPINIVYNVMDSIMLKVLQKDISIGVTIFEQMFKKVKPDSFARFMTQQATFVDFILVIWAMPKMPFCVAAFKQLFAGLTSNLQSSTTSSSLCGADIVGEPSKKPVKQTSHKSD